VGQMRWFRLDCDIDQLPKARKAGYGGVAIWLALARVSAQFDLGNLITPEFADPEFLADHLRTTADRISADIAAAIRAGLVSLAADGSLLIDMDRFVSPDTAKKRTQRAAATGTVPDCPGQPGTVPDCPGQPGTGRDCPSTEQNRTGQDRTNRTDKTGQKHDLEIDRTLGGDKPDPAADEPPQAATPATTPKPKKLDPLKHITLNESTWAFDGITNEDRAAWAKDAPHVNLDRELSAMLAYAQTHPGKLAAWRKGGRWVSTIAAWMIRAQQFAEKRPGGTATVPRKQDDPTRDRYGREYSSVRIARELGITVGGP
jgi:hypothetical protein